MITARIELQFYLLTNMPVARTWILEEEVDITSPFNLKQFRVIILSKQETPQISKAM